MSYTGVLAGLPPVSGIINSGGVLADAAISRQTAAGVRSAFAPKLGSAVAMHQDSRVLPVSQVLLFSSVSSLLGAPGQANYAGANAALEGWMAASSSQGVNGVAVQWGAWAVGKPTSYRMPYFDSGVHMQVLEGDGDYF